MKKELPYSSSKDAIIGYENSQIAKNETNDCVVRALASGFEMEYDETHKFVRERFLRQNRKGTYRFNSGMHGISEKKEVINGKCLKIMGQKDTIGYTMSYNVKVKGVVKKRKMTVGTFSKKYPKGTFIISVRAHAFTIKDGVVIGNQCDAKSLKRIVEQAWEVVKSN